MVELVIVACTLLQPTKCFELRLATGFASVGNCEREDSGVLLLVAGAIMNYPTLKATSYRCIAAGSEYDT